MKYGIQVWADWDGTGEKSFMWLSAGRIHDEFLVESFDTEVQAEYLANQMGENCIVAPLPDALCGRTGDAS